MKKIIFVCFILSLLTLINLDYSYAQWTQSYGLERRYVNCIIGGTGELYAGTDTGVFRSTNSGLNWSFAGRPANRQVFALVLFGNAIFAGTDGGIWKSADGGFSWTPSLNLSYSYRAFHILSPTILLSLGSLGLYSTTNNGLVWNFQGGVLPQSGYSLLGVSSGIYIGTQGSGVQYTSNNGGTYSQAGLSGNFVYDMVMTGSNILAATGTRMYITSNNGINWSSINNGLPNSAVYALDISGQYILAGTQEGVYLTQNLGSSWIAKNQGLGNIPIISLFIGTTYVYAGSWSQGSGVSSLWRRPLSDITSVNELGVLIPDNFKLYQNYPNPFNPETKIKFDIPYNSDVILEVFDNLGKQITVLVNKKMNAGSYEAVWNASVFPSGLYFCKLQTGSFTDTRKMILVR